jgi:hypothetical protein
MQIDVEERCARGVGGVSQRALDLDSIVEVPRVPEISDQMRAGKPDAISLDVVIECGRRRRGAHQLIHRLQPTRRRSGRATEQNTL